MKNIAIALCAFMMSVNGYVMSQSGDFMPNQVEEGNLMQNYTVVQKPSLIVIGIECRTSNDLDAGPQDIPKLWERFYSENLMDQIPNKVSHEVIALYCDYEGDYTKPYSLVIGCQVTSLGEIPKGMVAKVLPASSYAVFNAKGEYPKSFVIELGEKFGAPACNEHIVVILNFTERNLSPDLLKKWMFI